MNFNVFTWTCLIECASRITAFVFYLRIILGMLFSSVLHGVIPISSHISELSLLVTVHLTQSVWLLFLSYPLAYNLILLRNFVWDVRGLWSFVFSDVRVSVPYSTTYYCTSGLVGCTIWFCFLTFLPVLHIRLNTLMWSLSCSYVKMKNLFEGLFRGIIFDQTAC